METAKLHSSAQEADESGAALTAMCTDLGTSLSGLSLATDTDSESCHDSSRCPRPAPWR